MQETKLLLVDNYDIRDPVDKRMERSFHQLASRIHDRSLPEVLTELRQEETTNQYKTDVIDASIYGILTNDDKRSHEFYDILSFHLHDETGFIMDRLTHVCGHCFDMLRAEPKVQLMWLLEQLIKRKDVHQVEDIAILLLRQIRSPKHGAMVERFHELLFQNRECSMYYPRLYAASVIVFLRIITRNIASPLFKKLEDYICHFLTVESKLCSMLGRDLIRSLHDIRYKSEKIGTLYSSILKNGLGLTEVRNLLSVATPKEFLLSVVPYNADEDALFVLNNDVSSESVLRIYSEWFRKSHFTDEYIISDILRYLVNQVDSKQMAIFVRIFIHDKGELASKEMINSINIPLIFDWACFTGSAIRKFECPLTLTFDYINDIKNRFFLTYGLRGLDALCNEYDSRLSPWFRKNISKSLDISGYARKLDALMESNYISEDVKNIGRNLFFKSTKNSVDDEQINYEESPAVESNVCAPQDIESLKRCLLKDDKIQATSSLDSFFESFIEMYASTYPPNIVQVAETLVREDNALSDSFLLKLLIFCFSCDTSRISNSYNVFRKLVIIADKSWLYYISKLANTDFDLFLRFLHRFVRYIPEMVGNIEFIRLVLCSLDTECTYKFISRYSLGEFSLFIDDKQQFVISVSNIGSVSCEWDSFEQSNFWTFLRIEMSIFPQVHKLFFNDDLIGCLAIPENIELRLGVYQVFTVNADLIERAFMLEFIIKCFEKNLSIAGDLLRFFIARNCEGTVYGFLQLAVSVPTRASTLIQLIDHCTLHEDGNRSGLNRFGKILYRNPDFASMVVRLRETCSQTG